MSDEPVVPLKKPEPVKLEPINYAIQPGEVIISISLANEDGNISFNLYKNIDSEDQHSVTRYALAYGLAVYAAQNPDKLCDLAFSQFGGAVQGNA